MKKPKIDYIPARKLTIDTSYQRDRNDARVSAIVAAFDESLIGVLVVSRRAGRNNVPDGQHRLAALMQIDPNYKVPCLVYNGLTLAEEAKLFRQLNRTRVRVDDISDYRAALVAEDSRAIAIKTCLDKHGLGISRKISSRSLCAVGAVHTVFDNCNLPAVLPLAVRWRDRSQSNAAYQATILLALSDFMLRFPEADLTALAHRLDGDTPEKFSARQEAAADRMPRVEKSKSRKAGLETMLELYNVRNRKPLSFDKLRAA